MLSSAQIELIFNYTAARNSTVVLQVIAHVDISVFLS